MLRIFYFGVLFCGLVFLAEGQERSLIQKKEFQSDKTILTLDQCRALAVAHNHELQQEQEEIEGAKAKRAEVLTNYLPQINVVGAWMQVDKPFRPIDWDYLMGSKLPVLSSLLDRYTAIHVNSFSIGGITAVQPVFLGGKLYHGTKMADAAVRLKETMAETKRTEVEEKVEETYWQVVKLQSKKALVKKLIALLDDAIKNVDIAVREGVATRAEALEIRVKRSEAEVKQNKVNNGLHLSRMLLAQQCGLGVADLVIPADALNLNELGLLSQSSTQMVIDTTALPAYVERRSEVRSLMLADTIFAHKEGVEGADMWPKAFLFGSYMGTNPNPFHAPRHRFEGAWAVGVGVSIPITGILTGSYKRKQAHSERLVKQLALTDAREKITLQMNQALLNRRESLLALEAAEKSLNHAEENLHYANVGYKEGVIPLLNLTMAQTAWAKAHDAYIDAYVEAQLNESKIKHIFGYE